MPCDQKINLWNVFVFATCVVAIFVVLLSSSFLSCYLSYFLCFCYVCFLVSFISFLVVYLLFFSLFLLLFSFLLSFCVYVGLFSSVAMFVCFSFFFFPFFVFSLFFFVLSLLFSFLFSPDFLLLGCISEIIIAQNKELVQNLGRNRAQVSPKAGPRGVF